MELKKRATEAAPIQNLTGAKVRQEKDIEKVLDFFRYKVGTTLDCMFATGVLRNCITWYVRDLERLGLLQAIYIAKDRRTHFYAKHYSADPAKWAQAKTDAQLSLSVEG
ncbi:hypothetical protein [Phocaeicola salanitronis]|uniref:hypothetical protein n=1 Tax=Phocaeicola salanitronis TaxID=376805 RepID=UPI0025A36377|nr:hypothetical protein [Phocaeicola salanitronis]MDM8305242.1 hypothetical protein [Phocaeicola salanitronis]